MKVIHGGFLNLALSKIVIIINVMASLWEFWTM